MNDCLCNGKENVKNEDQSKLCGCKQGCNNSIILELFMNVQ